MGTIFFLILFPLVVAFVLLVVKADAARGAIVKIAAIVIAAASIYLAVQYFRSGDQYFDFHNEYVNYVMMVIEALLAIYIIITGIRHKKYLASVFAIIQTPLLIWFELTKGHHIEVCLLYTSGTYRKRERNRDGRQTERNSGKSRSPQ